ncbi:MAG: ABC-F family ATP-binding cassette domain-containing protein [Acidimicrobiaceae bacterium]|nr:ABC-F family ATP-binding cassette domain-containing protein [Acidimicrobiaceae bacterium]
MLTAENLSVEVGGKLILNGVSFRVAPGDKVGIVGRNGAGKTSMLKVVSGEVPPTTGRIAIIGDIGYLNQEPKADESIASQSVLDRVISGRSLDVLAGDLEKARLAMELDPSEANIKRFARREEIFALKGGYQAESEAKKILVGLGITESRFPLNLSYLSGGERRRVELARILFAGSDVLLLDEPTNHLDLDSKNWLLSFMRGYSGAMMVISHDLDLLDEAITRIFHLERGNSDGELIEYKGTFSQYKKARAGDELSARKRNARLQGEIKRLTSQADSMRHSTAKRAKVAQSIDKRVGRLFDQVGEVSEHSRIKVGAKMIEPPPCGKDVLSVSQLCKGFGQGSVFEDVSFDVSRSERLLIVGLNGAGKTTLLRLVTGELRPDIGHVKFGKDVSVGYYAQEHENLDPFDTPVNQMNRSLGGTITESRGLLASFGLSGDVIFQPTETLSGGEKTKLSLSLLVAARHNLLLLDEPTNNLDPESRVAVGKSLALWPGTMLVVTHDEAFAEAISPDKVLILPDGLVDYYDDNYLELVAMA